MGKKTFVILPMLVLTFFCVSQAFSQGENTLLPGNVRIESGLSIGGVDDYFTFPGARGAANTVIVATDGSGTTAWQLIQDKNLQGIGEAAGAAGQVLGSNGTGGFVWVAQGTEGILRLTSAYIVVDVTAESTALQNGQYLLDAYDYAVTTLTNPNGETRSAKNRTTVLIPPGQYDLADSNLVLSEPYVDLVGLSTARSAQYIVGVTDGTNGVITQEVSDVRIENLTVECEKSSGSPGSAAYYPTSGTFPDTIVRNCEFVANETNAYSMRIDIQYLGVFENCKAGDYSFGGGVDGIASGTFIHCIGGLGAFGGSGGLASGTFRDCIGGDESFGGGDDGSGEGAVFWDCAGGVDAFGSGGQWDGCLCNGVMCEILSREPGL